MTSPVQTPYLDLKKQLWKARAQAKQKWLEQSLAQPATSTDEAEWRTTWIKRALNMVKRGQAPIKQQAALMDAYTEHLSVLEMTVIAAAEQKRKASEQKRSVEKPHAESRGTQGPSTGGTRSRG